MLVSPSVAQGLLAASAPTRDRANSPIWHGYQAEIPEGWTALQPVAVRELKKPPQSVSPDIPAEIDQEMQRFSVGVLLCRQGTDGREARQEFVAGVLAEEAFLDGAGQYLRAAPKRPAYGVLPLASPNEARKDPTGSRACLVLLPLVDFPYRATNPLPQVMMFVGGVSVYCDSLWPGVA